MSNFLEHLAHLYLEAAPWLLLGLVAAGLIKAWVADERLARWLGGRGPWATLKAALIGAPLPLCSCGVLPAALGLRRAGASREATLSFLIATPETGPDSIAVSYALLGPFLAIARPLAAVASAVFTGLLSRLVVADDTAGVSPRGPATPAARSPDACCGGETGDEPRSHCCGSVRHEEIKLTDGPLNKTWRGLRYAFSRILDDLSLWLGIGLVLAALVATWVPPLAMAAWGSGLGAKLLMLAVGVPMYVCATASTPVAAGLLLAGISPGTVLVFLLAGPATNLATILVIRREMGSATMLAYLAGIAIASLALGIAVDWLASTWRIDILAQLDEAGELVPQWLAVACGALLAMLSIRPLRRHLIGA